MATTTGSVKTICFTTFKYRLIKIRHLNESGVFYECFIQRLDLFCLKKLTVFILTYIYTYIYSTVDLLEHATEFGNAI